MCVEGKGIHIATDVAKQPAVKGVKEPSSSAY